MNTEKQLRTLIREEIKKILKSRTNTGILKEGFAWQRKPGQKGLPTLKDVQTEYQKKKAKQLSEAAEDDDVWFKDDTSGDNLDDKAGGVDNSLNKAHTALLKLQKEMDKLLIDFKNNRITKDIYIAKRKPLQDKRDKLEAALIGVDSTE